MKTFGLSKSHYCVWISAILFLLTACKQSGSTSGKSVDFEPIPYFSIDTGNNTIVDEPKVAASMKITLNDEEVLTHGIGIEYRGSTSQKLFDKKSYGLETWDEAGDDTDVSILGMPEEEDWILYGPYSDKTLIRNLIIYELAREIGRYAVRTELAELEINGDYLGAYIFMEKIKRDDERLDIKKLDEEDITPDKITGGYILKIDKTTGDTDDNSWAGDVAYSEELGFRSVFGADGDSLTYAPYGDKQGEETYFLYEEPDYEDITSGQKDYIQNYIHEFENALLSDDFNSNERTYTDYIDLDSFVDFFILNELSANPDAYRLSTFMYKDRGGKLSMGPIWDFNIAFGNDGRSTTGEWIYRYNERVGDDLWLVHFWWKRLMEDPQFTQALKSRWGELRNNELSTQSVLAKVEAHSDRIINSELAKRNFTRWEVLGEELPFNSYVVDTYPEEIDYLSAWTLQRLTWMDQEISSF